MLVSKKRYNELRKQNIRLISEIEKLTIELINLKKKLKTPAKKATAKPAKKAGTK